MLVENICAPLSPFPVWHQPSAMKIKLAVMGNSRGTMISIHYLLCTNAYIEEAVCKQKKFSFDEADKCFRCQQSTDPDLRNQFSITICDAIQ